MIFSLKYFFVVSLYGLLLISFNIFVNIHVYVQLFKNFLCKEFDEPQLKYDYIIIGSGTAGSILALRLAQEKHNKILLLEAGSYSNTLLDIPAITPMLQKTYLDWQYETTPQNFACRAMRNNISYWPMGKVYGGSHRLSNMIHVRGHKEDYFEWFHNKTDFNYENDILYYYRKVENWLGSNVNDNPLYLNNLKYVSMLGEAVLDAAEYLKLPIKNINAQPGIGFMKPHVTTHKNKRWTTSHSLLQQKFTNLQIITNAHVNKIIFKNNYEASSVQYTFLGDTMAIKARKGVILSAGAIGTPKILLLSGVGPDKHLRNIKIRVRKKLPVGENLMDHITTGLDLIILNQSLTVNLESLVSPISAYKYFFHQTGPWMTTGCEVIGFCHTKTSQLDAKPNLQLLVIPAGISSDSGKHLKNILGVKQNVWDNYFISLIGKQVASILPVVLHPKSRGTVKLKSTDPNEPPEINPNYLFDQNDVDILLQGIQIIKKIIETEPMQKLGAKLNPTPFPGCQNFEFDTKYYWECYVRHLSLTSYHPGGTCRMGDAGDLKSVVDYNFKVIGMNKLFIADASIFPTLPTGNPNSVVAMLAEKAADDIKYHQFLMIGKCKQIDILVQKNVSML